MSVRKTRKHKKVKYNKHKRTNKVANKVANKTKRHRRHRVHKKNKKRATKKQLRGGDNLVGINPFYYGDRCELCEIAEKERGMAHYLKERMENFLTEQKKYYSHNKYNSTNNKQSIGEFIDNLEIGDNRDESEQMKDYFNNFIDNQNKDEPLSETLKKFVEQYDNQSKYCESCQKTLPPPPLPPRRQRRLPPRRQRRSPPPPIDLCNREFNLNVDVNGRNKEGKCICNYGSEYDENVGTCLCKKGFEKNKEGLCIKHVPEGVYGAIPGLQQGRSSKPSDDCQQYKYAENCEVQSQGRCAWYEEEQGNKCLSKAVTYPVPLNNKSDNNHYASVTWNGGKSIH